MNKLIEILPNIYGVKGLIKENYKAVYYINDNKTLIYNSDYIDAKTLLSLDGRFKLLGFLTKDEISFDASDIVDRHKNCMRFIDYKNRDISKKYFDSAEQSFRSALPEEIYFENPKPHPSDIEPTNRNHYEALKDAWQTAQENITEKLLILQKL